MIARPYLIAFSLSYWAVTLWEIAFRGTWLGLLGRRSLHAVDDLMYRRDTRYATEEHNTGGLLGWERQAMRDHFGGCRRLVVIGAGGGREVIALTEAGYAADGFECNAALMAVANRYLEQRGHAVRVLPLERDAAPAVPPDGRWDGAFVGWSTYMLIIGRQARIRFLRDLARTLSPGAPVLLSFFTRSGDSPRAVGVWKLANAIRRVRRLPPVELGDDLAPNFVHRFTEEEVRAELAEAGFRMLTFVPERLAPTESGYAVGGVEASEGGQTVTSA